MVRSDNGIVAKGYVTSGATVSLRQRQVILEPATDYVLSAYMWNFGDAANYVNTVMDFNDAPGEPQLTLYAGAEADQGYFIYNYFNTSVTGTNLTLRAFYDGLTGTGTSSAYFPLAAQWDNTATNEQRRHPEPITIKHEQHASVVGHAA